MTQEGRVAGKVALITGGGSGIGREISILLAEQGAEVVVTSLDPAQVGEVCTAIERRIGHPPAGHALDVGDRDAVDEVVQAVARDYGRIDIVSNNAGIELVHEPSITEITDDEWETVMRVNATGTFYVCRAAIPFMPPGGAIVNMGSLKSLAPRVNAAAYVASKAALLQFTRALALELAPRGIRANCVCPGTIDTPLTRLFLDRADDPENLLRTYKAKSPFLRMGTPREVAHCVLFLASAESSWVTGTAFVVDGGTLLK